jgi:hypothetical protein
MSLTTAQKALLACLCLSAGLLWYLNAYQETHSALRQTCFFIFGEVFKTGRITEIRSKAANDAVSVCVNAGIHPVAVEATLMK